MKIAPISIVIPTRNRLNSLNRTLQSVREQKCVPAEIIIVDSSDMPIQKDLITVDFPESDLKILTTSPSVCSQRNLGIVKSNYDFIVLLDDDVTLSQNYLQILLEHLQSNSNQLICSGMVLENRNGNWTYSEPEKSTAALWAAYWFGLSVGMDMQQSMHSVNFLKRKLTQFYRKKGNTISKAGWPIITDFSSPMFTTAIYGLGASMVRAENLKGSLFDEVFHANGIGDNYDLAISLKSTIDVLTDAKAYHHRESTNRLKPAKAYYFRISALHYILLKHSGFSKVNLLWFLHSLLGNSILFLTRGKFDFLHTNNIGMLRILFNFPLYKSRK